MAREGQQQQHTENNIRARMFEPTQTITLTEENLNTFERKPLERMMQNRGLWKGAVRNIGLVNTPACERI